MYLSSSIQKSIFVAEIAGWLIAGSNVRLLPESYYNESELIDNFFG